MNIPATLPYVLHTSRGDKHGSALVSLDETESASYICTRLAKSIQVPEWKLKQLSHINSSRKQVSQSRKARSVLPSVAVFRPLSRR
jgi:hypothetical protein